MMNMFERQIKTLTEIYQNTIWINVDFSDLDPDLTQAEINQVCLIGVSKYLSDSLGLVVKPTFPSDELHRSFVAKIINGFILSISGVRVAFIPSQDLDLSGFEIQREWVELGNWVADYYVPIQVIRTMDSPEDRANSCLHLWGFISHQHLLKRATLDQNLRVYEVESADLIDDLDALWIASDLVTSGMTAPERGQIPSLAPLSDSAAKTLIDRLQQHQSVFSPRLGLPFEQWGAILDRPEYFRIYAHPQPVITKIADWFRSQVNAIETIGNTRADRGWVTIAEICQQPAPLLGYMATSSQKTKFAVNGIPLGNEREIYHAVNNLYANQNPAKQVDLPTDIDSPLLLLVYLMQHTTDETLRWQAAEYLWTIEPNNSKNWHRRIKDLGLIMQGHKLGLMVAAIPLLDGTYAILNRVYPIGTEQCLPPNVRLNLLSENGEQLYQVESRSTVMDSYIQLPFTASSDVRFNIRISMNDASITEAFAIE